ncbi:MAG: helix-turn-helix domain-containing protein, partial [Planctomycetes bacterium]|nr:helix-turn-helix domain-containing protein [Planctomycetota bacterium]
ILQRLTLEYARLPDAVQQWLLEKLQQAGSRGEVQGLYESLLAEVEPVLLTEALQRSGGNRREAARLLGIHRQTLREKLRRHGLDSPEEQ